MNGIFAEQVELVNRAPVDISVQFDGQSKVLVPGVNIVPKIVVPYAKNQNPIMGTQDPYNPHISGCQYLVGVKVPSGKQKDPIEPLTDAEWADHLGKPCREDVQQLFEDRYGTDFKAKLVTLNKGKKTTARSRHDAGASPTGNADFSGKQ
jgi:hypothetical protein